MRRKLSDSCIENSIVAWKHEICKALREARDQVFRQRVLASNLQAS
jgi:hypothetical protein